LRATTLSAERLSDINVCIGGGSREKPRAHRLPKLGQKKQEKKAHRVARGGTKGDKIERKQDVALIQMRHKRHLEKK
jgi:hypothetical protein